MSTPACIANAVADALGAAEIRLPLVPSALAALIHGAEAPAPAGRRPVTAQPVGRGKGERLMRGAGEALVAATPEAIWAMLLDPEMLAAIIPGAHGVERVSPTAFRAEVTLGIGPVKGRYKAEVSLSDLDPPKAVTLTGRVTGNLGFGGGSGAVTLAPDGAGGTQLSYTYEAFVGGKVASVGGRLLDGAAKVIIGQFFAALARKAGGAPAASGFFSRLLARLAALFGRGPA